MTQSFNFLLWQVSSSRVEPLVGLSLTIVSPSDCELSLPKGTWECSHRHLSATAHGHISFPRSLCSFPAHPVLLAKTTLPCHQGTFPPLLFPHLAGLSYMSYMFPLTGLYVSPLTPLPGPRTQNLILENKLHQIRVYVCFVCSPFRTSCIICRLSEKCKCRAPRLKISKNLFCNGTSGALTQHRALLPNT